MRYTLIRQILFSPLEDKIHIFAPPCNIHFIYALNFVEKIIYRLKYMVSSCIFVSYIKLKLERGVFLTISSIRNHDTNL